MGKGRSIVLEESSGKLKIQLNLGVIVRLFGLPFLGAGLFFLYYLVLGLINITEYDGVGEAALALGVLVVMTLAFGVPGAFLTLTRKSVVLDKTTDQVISTTDWIVYKRIRTDKISNFRAVEAIESQNTTRDSKTGSTRTSYNYPINLLPKAGTSYEVLVAIGDSPAEGVEVGKRVAEFIGVDFVDSTNG